MIRFWLKLWELTRPYRGRFIIGILAGVMSGLMEALVVVVAALVVGTIFFNPNASDTQKYLKYLPAWVGEMITSMQQSLAAHVSESRLTTLILVSFIPLVLLLRGVVNYLNAYLMNWVAIRAICDLRARLFAHLQSQPLSFLTRMSTPELMSRVNDAGVLQNMIAVSMVTIVREPINALALISVQLKINPKLTLLALVVLPACAIPVMIYNKKGRKSAAANQTDAVALSKVMHESFAGNRIIKAYNLEDAMTERYSQALKRYISHYMRIVRATETPGPIIEVIGAIGVAGLLVYLTGTTAPEASVVFILALLSMYKPIKAVVRVWSQLHQASSATDRLFDLLNTPSSMPEAANPVPLKAAGADIHFDNIHFGYDDKPVLRGLQLRVKPGQMVALVGGTGGGKTTITNLLLRFYDPTSGTVRIGGTDIRDVALKDLRAQIAVVTQDVILFNDTIARNIGYGRPGATQAEIEEAAKHAFAHDFILEKPKGYESVIGERGTNLSGGQRQRLAIARAILKDAPILILDEATSSLDNEAERIVQAALDELMKGRTTICVAHRLSTVRNADVIVAIERGEIVEMGRHEELLQRGGVYQKLYNLSVATGSGVLVAPEPKPTREIAAR
jgi:subfamily B ATP-binding cassette protein MsbA